MRRLVTNPWSYVTWTVLLSAALYGTYFGDPYVFGFTTLALASLTAAASVAGLATCVFSNRPRPRDRVIIVGALALAAVAIAKALATLGTFEWA